MKAARLASQSIDQPIIQSTLKPDRHFETLEIEISVGMRGVEETRAGWREKGVGMQGRACIGWGGEGVCGGWNGRWAGGMAGW